MVCPIENCNEPSIHRGKYCEKHRSSKSKREEITDEKLVCISTNCNNPRETRGKFCIIHRPRKTKFKNVVNTTDDNGLFIPEIVFRFCEYLTIYEIDQFSKLSKYLYNMIAPEEFLFQKLVKRDFGFILKNNYRSKALQLDYGVKCVCDFCPDMTCKYVLACQKHTKFLSPNEIQNLYERRNYNLLEPFLTSMNSNKGISHQMVSKKLAQINYGITNNKFQIVRAKIESQRIKEELRIKQEKQRLEEIRFKHERESWFENIYNKRFDYSGMTATERRELLQNELNKYGLKIRHDSQLAKQFIEGNIRDKCVEECAGILEMTSNMFSYSHRVFSNFHDICKEELRTKMYIEKENERYTWKLAVRDILYRYKKEFIKEDNRYESDDDYYDNRWNNRWNNRWW